MNLEEYRKQYLENVKTSAAADGEGTVVTFVTKVLEDLEDSNAIQDFSVNFGSGKVGRRNYRVDAYSFDDYDNSMSLFIADYSGDEEIATLTRTDAKALFDKVEAFLDGSINRNLIDEIEISTPLYDVVENLRSLKNDTRKYKLFILTDKQMSSQIKSLEMGTFNGKPVEYNIWDINRIFRLMNTGSDHEPIEIDFSDVMKNIGSSERGIPYLLAVDDADLKSYLCVIPGKVLANLYDIFGSRLLEGNVRSFLSTRGKVNKEIRKTISEIGEGRDKRLFFSYNNGISATASNVRTDQDYIISINNLQIVNGGQTTASLSNAQYKDHANLDGIYVQMKLTVIPDDEMAHKLIPNISRFSNSQNKVSDADFFSNHEFNVRMEKISRSLYAPSINGNQFETHWFFERSRGQYEQAQSRMTKGEQKKFIMQNPKSQKITKTDMAKFMNTWEEKPYFVCLGAQKNFSYFAQNVVDLWDKNDKQFDEQYYRNLISIAIMFKYLDVMIRTKCSWYEKGYKANTIAYTLSYFRELIHTHFPKHELNLQLIWNQQFVPQEIQDEFLELAHFVYLHITSDKRAITNVTEWTKKKACWDALLQKKYTLSDKIDNYLLDSDEQKIQQADRKKEFALNHGINVQSEVVKKGAEYWERAIAWGHEHNMISEVDSSFLKAATKMNYGRIPSEKQCQRILNIEARLIDEGFM